MRCTKCNNDNPADASFCESCGAKLELTCPACKASLSPGARFCKKCGTAIGAAALGQPLAASAKKSNDSPILVAEAPAPENLEGERKTVTALFADIKGSTELEQDLDPEEARAIVDPALKLMIEGVQRYDGYVVQSTGDGIFAIFGAPVAHEDHPQRALYAAIRMQEELRRYGSKLQAEGRAPIEIRVGVNTGEVVVRSITTGAGQVEYTPIGHTTNLASRLQSIARTGSIVVSESTRKLVEGYFALKPLGPTKVKGVSEPVNVYEVTGLGPIRTRLQRSAGRGYTKFVGRESEMSAMEAAAERAKSGHGQIVAAMAEAGAGKSRLFFEFKAKYQSGWMVLETFSVSHGKASSYLPVIELLWNYFKITSEDDRRARREKVTGRVLALERTLEDTLPYLFSLLGIIEGDDLLAQMDGQIRKRRTLDAIKRIMLRESLNQPLMVIFEDLHWIDDETQALLNIFADSIPNSKILMMVNYRPEYSHQWGSKTYYTQLRLDPLGKENADEMLTSLVGDHAEIRPLKHLIIERTQGNPFFMEETVQVLRDEGALVRDGVEDRLTKPLGELKIPPTVQSILAARIDRLPAAEKDLLQTLAVIGKEFQLSLIRAVTAKSDDDLNRMLSELQLAEFIYEQPAVGDVEYTFKHALTLEVAYNSVLGESRRATHQRTANAIETLFADRLEDHYSGLAHHYLLSNDQAKAIRYLQLRADHAIARSAYVEAANAIGTGLGLLERLPTGGERSRVELALRASESSVAVVLYGWSSRQREQAIQRTCILAEQLEEKSLLVRALVSLSSFYFTRGEPLLTRQASKRCLELAERRSDGAALAYAAFVVGCAADSSGRLDEAASRYAEAMVHAEKANQQDLIIPIAVWSASAVQRSSVLAPMGRVTEAVKLAEDGLRYARESRHLYSLGHALAIKARVHCYLQEPGVVLEHAEEMIALSEEHGFAEWSPWGTFVRGWGLAALERLEEGVADMAEGIAGFGRLGGVPFQRFSTAMLAHGYARLGRLSEAMNMLDRALEHIERSGEFHGQAEMLRLKGEILLMGNKPDATEAEHCFRAALDVAVAQGARWWEMRVTTSLARLLDKQGHRDEARAMLSAIYNWFTEGFDTTDLKDAKALLDELGA